jgi:O-antigen/teichoic acid export membrane protein
MAITSHLKKLYNNPSVRSLGIYTFTNFFSKSVSFLLLFVFTNPAYISPAENGLLSLFSTSILFLMPFLSIGIIHSVSADFYKMEKEDFRNYFTTSFIIPVIIMVLSVVVLLLFRDKLQQQFGFPAMFGWLIPLVTFLIFCNEQLLNLARNNNEPVIYLRANIGKTLLEFGISFILVVFLAYRWQGRIAGILAAYTILGVYAFAYFSRKGYLFGAIKKNFIYSELLYAVPIIALQASIFSMNASDKFFLSHFTTDQNETVGIYSIACVFASVINILSMALLQYYFPKIFSILAREKIDYDKIKKKFLYYFFIMLAGLMLALLLTPFLYTFFIHEKYHGALNYICLLFIGNFLWSIGYFFYSFLLYHKAKRKILYLSLSCIAVSLSSNYFFIKNGNAQGAATAVCITYGIVTVFSLLFSWSYWKYFFIRNDDSIN